MATVRRDVRPPAEVEKRGGYASGDKPVSELRPPRRGPAPGARPATVPQPASDRSTAGRD